MDMFGCGGMYHSIEGTCYVCGSKLTVVEGLGLGGVGCIQSVCFIVCVLG